MCSIRLHCENGQKGFNSLGMKTCSFDSLSENKFWSKFSGIFYGTFFKIYFAFLSFFNFLFQKYIFGIGVAILFRALNDH